MKKYGNIFFAGLIALPVLFSGCKTTDSARLPSQPDGEKLARAKDTLQQLPTVNERVAEQLYQQGLSLEEEGYYPEATTLYRRAAKLQPSFAALIWMQLGALYRVQGQYVLAQEALAQAVTLNPGSALGYYQLALAYAESSDAANATAALQKAMAINPDLPEALDLLRQLSPQSNPITQREMLPPQEAAWRR